MLNATASAQILERRDQIISKMELREQSLQATISALHEELASVRAEVTALTTEKRNFRIQLLRERCERLIDKEVTERRLLMGQEEVDRCGLHNFLIDHAIQESVSLLGEAGYRTLVVPGNVQQQQQQQQISNFSNNYPGNVNRGLVPVGRQQQQQTFSSSSPMNHYYNSNNSRNEVGTPQQAKGGFVSPFF